MENTDELTNWDGTKNVNLAYKCKSRPLKHTIYNFSSKPNIDLELILVRPTWA